MKALLVLSVFFMDGWAGWYNSNTQIAQAIEQANSHPLAPCNGAIMEGDILQGSGTLVHREWVLTAAHVVAPGVSDVKTGVYALTGELFFSNSASPLQDVDRDITRAVSACMFPEQDLCFLKLEKPCDTQKVVKIIEYDHYRALASSRHYKMAVPYQGPEALFFGYGFKRSTTEIDKENAYEIVRKAHYNPVYEQVHFFGQKALGNCHLTQYFDEPTGTSSFFSWMNLKKGPENKSLLVSSALPGDSGGGMFVPQNNDFYLTGVTNKVFMSDSTWHQGTHHVGTKFITLYSAADKEKESYLDKVLRWEKEK
ncbi:MAG: trypsin-like serine protease [Alphaproteobacteria bacterium]